MSAPTQAEVAWAVKVQRSVHAGTGIYTNAEARKAQGIMARYDEHGTAPPPDHVVLRLPHRWVDDARSRDLDIGTTVKVLSRDEYVVHCTSAQLDEIASAADYDAVTYKTDEDRDLRGLAQSAAAVLRRIDTWLAS